MPAYNPYGYGFSPAFYPQPPVQTQMPAPQQPVPQPVPPVTAQPNQGLSPASRPVGNREEANAVPADFSGAPMVFHDAAHDRVYVKRWNYQTGAADFAEYVRMAPQTAQEAPEARTVEYVPRSEYDALAARVKALEDKKCGCAAKTRKKEEAQDGTDE